MQDRKNTRIMYVAPRLHTNMVPILRGWHEKGCPVAFLAQYEAKNEVHDYVYYHVVKGSFISRIIQKALSLKFDAAIVTSKMIYAFIPSIVDIIREIRKFSPDIVIMRERNRMSAVTNIVCLLCGIRKRILYIQAPLLMGTSRNSIKKAIQKLCFPKVTYSPILFKGIRDCPTIATRSHEWFVPLVTEANQNQRKTYCANHKLHILDIGKYQDYKNHFFLVDALAPFCEDEGIEVTIIGQGSSPGEMAYKKRLLEYISQKKLESIIRVTDNINYAEMPKQYEANDVLILPSKGEGAGMVILEAMGQGLCVLSSIYCGLSSYVRNAGCGITFDLKDPAELTEAIAILKNNHALVEHYGERAVMAVLSDYSFTNYYQAITQLCEKEYGYSIMIQEN